MQIEKKLAQTDLNKYKTQPQNDIKSDTLKLLIKQLYKYQKFSTKAVLEKINMMNFKKSTVIQYYRYMKRYLATGEKTYTYEQMYNIIDELKAKHEAILTPSENERYIAKKYKPAATSPTTTPIKAEPPKYIEKIPPQYGVKCENTIKLFSSKDMCLGYIECYKVIGDGKPVELVTVDLEIESI